MFQPSAAITESPLSYSAEPVRAPKHFSFASPATQSAWLGIQRRWRRERRRRKVGRAYDMALEIARLVPAGSRVLDVGCGNGFIAHHLASMIGPHVTGIDLAASTQTAIHYREFDGKHFPVADNSMDAALLCYVLHHAQDLGTIMNELRRVLGAGGVAIIYEDIPSTWWDRLICLTHDLKWRKRTGPCTFRREAEWRSLFDSVGFEIITERGLSRGRNLAHPVRRRLFIVKPVTE
jgi:ubiquinone/menaquinone biosynthesis C-methylase UbiE